jgi:ankyrin repeat protein
MSKALKAAIEHNDPDQVRKAVRSVKDLNRKMPGSATPILLACAVGADRVLEPLVEAGAKVKGVDGYAGNHPFAVAAEKGKTSVMSRLVEMKEVPDDVIDHALMIAAMEGREEVLRFMVARFRPNPGAKIVRMAGHSRKPGAIRAVAEGTGAIHATEEGTALGSGLTPLHSSVGYADLEVIRTLVDCGAGVNARDSLGRTPLMVLAHEMEMLRLNGKEPDGLAAMKELVRLGAGAELVDHDGNDAVDHYVYELARSKEEPEPGVVAFLKQAGAKGSEATFRLFQAIIAEDVAGMRKAIADGADVNRLGPPHSDATPLTMASVRSPDVVAVLLEAGADVNKPDRSQTPLISAAGSGNLEVVKQLVAAGADVEALEQPVLGSEAPRDNAYSMAEKRSRHEVVDYLKSLGSGRPKPQTWKAVTAGVHHWNDFEEILVKGDTGPVARGLARIIGGTVEPQAYGKTFKVATRAYVVARPKGMRWCNLIQVAPPRAWRPDRDAQAKFCRDLAAACGAPVMIVGYSDTSDAVGIERYNLDGSLWEYKGWDRDLLEEVVENAGEDEVPGLRKMLTEMGEQKDDELTSTQRLVKMAEHEGFAVAALWVHYDPGRPVEVTFPDLPAEAFDAVAWVAD